MGEQRGDEAVLERLMETHGDRILRLCALCLGDRALAEDAAQETMLRAWRSFGAFRGESGEKTWITAVALNYCRGLLRSPWHRRRADGALLEQLWAEDAPRDDTLVRAVLALPGKYRQVIVLHYYQELSVREIAGALNIPENTVSTRLRRGRERLRPMLKEWYYEEG